MIERKELLESKEFWNELLENTAHRIACRPENLRKELKYVRKHIDELLENLKPNELRAVNRNEQAKEVCSKCGSTDHYIHTKEVRRCLQCDRVWQTD